MYKCKKFLLQELVSKQVYLRYGEFAWRFFGEDELQDLDTIREYHGQEIIINNWYWGGSLSQCGLRCNKDPLVSEKNTIYCSAHCLGKGFDLHSKDIKKLYADVEKLKTSGKLKKLRRIESAKTTKYGWCHVDSLQTVNNKLEIFT